MTDYAALPAAVKATQGVWTDPLFLQILSSRARSICCVILVALVMTILVIVAHPAHAQIQPGYALNTGGYGSGALTVPVTAANSTHAAGTSIGGLMSFAIARGVTYPSNTGDLSNLGWKSVGGYAGSMLVRIWQKKPANTTCTDNSAFVGSDVDDAFLVISPFQITTAPPPQVTGDSATYAQYGFVPPVDFKNQDTSPTQNLYMCVILVSSDAQDANNVVRATLSALQN